MYPTFNYQILLGYLSYHLITIAVVFCILITIIVHKIGTQKNRRIAEHYKNMLQPVLIKHFVKYQPELIKQSANILKLYPSVSVSQSCLFSILSFALVPRQQIVSFMGNWLLFSLKDELVVEIPINNQHPISMTATIVQRKNIRSITKKAYPDVKQLCKQYRPKQGVTVSNDASQTKGSSTSKFTTLAKTHCILVEKTDHVKLFFDSNKEIQLWQRFGKYIKMVYFSDVNKFSRYPMAIRIVIFLNDKQLVPIFQWLMAFVERMAKIKQHPNQRKQAMKKRQNLQIKYDD